MIEKILNYNHNGVSVQGWIQFLFKDGKWELAWYPKVDWPNKLMFDFSMGWYDGPHLAAHLWRFCLSCEYPERED